MELKELEKLGGKNYESFKEIEHLVIGTKISDYKQTY